MNSQNRLEFDSKLGGDIIIPPSINLVAHVHDRLEVIKKVYNEVNMCKADKLIHQSLPNYMRRRAMSHNPKRVPLKYRQIHINQMEKSGLQKTKKRPSRRYRRKPSNLMKEYVRRQQKNVWMETHIWHAKRFHMEDLWGYKIPVAPCDKRFRAAYKATSSHCLAQDISYIGCIQIYGPFEVLKEKLSRLTSSECGLSIIAKSFLSGAREGSAELFEPDKYPMRSLGKVQFIWKFDQSKMKTLWLFAHPNIYKELVEQLILLFSLQNAFREPVSKSEEMELDVKDLKAITKNNSFVRCPRYQNIELNVELTELKDTMNRFRLTGPLSNAVITRALKIASKTESSSWFNEWLKDETNQKAHINQTKYYKSIENARSPGELPCHLVLGLNVIDPRVNRPEKRIKAIASEKFYDDENNFNSLDELLLSAPLQVGVSGIWSRELRDELLKEQMSTHRLCELRASSMLVPGEGSNDEHLLQPIPILLIQQPGSQTQQKRLGFGSGFDLIVPAGYGLHFWHSLIQCGAKSGGWRDQLTLDNESGKDTFLPDSRASLKETARLSKKQSKKYFRLPPNKRINYRKFAIASPFVCNFKQLVKEWSGCEDYFVLRNKKLLQDLNLVLKNKASLQNLTIPKNALIPINLTMEARGDAGNNGLICLPVKKDIKNSLIQKHAKNNAPVLVEPLTKDEGEKERNTLKNFHKKLLKRMRNRRVRAKRRIQSRSSHYVKIQKSGAEKIIEEQYKRMCELWIPSNPKSIKDQCSRQVIGNLTTSRFTFTESRVCGVGYISAQGFIELIELFKKLKINKIFVLTRATDSRSYQTAQLKIREDL